MQWTPHVRSNPHAATEAPTSHRTAMGASRTGWDGGTVDACKYLLARSRTHTELPATTPPPPECSDFRAARASRLTRQLVG